MPMEGFRLFSHTGGSVRALCDDDSVAQAVHEPPVSRLTFCMREKRAGAMQEQEFRRGEREGEKRGEESKTLGRRTTWKERHRQGLRVQLEVSNGWQRCEEALGRYGKEAPAALTLYDQPH